MSAGYGPLVQSAWLARHLQDENIRVIDFRWYLDGRSGRAAYETGHIPGAVFVDLDTEVTGHEPGGGRHPLPSASQFEVSMRQAGVWSRSRVVVYDDMGGFSAARLWWLLRYFGHPAVAVLDGGLQSWTGAISTQAVEVQPGDFVAAGEREDMKAGYEQLRMERRDLVLLDARAPERFRGEVEPIDPKAGRIPGARSRPWQANLDAYGRFLPPEELRRGFQELGISSGSEAVAYCGSGVSACHNVLALEVAGMPRARLYPGSWSDWCSRPDAPVATGPDD